MKQINFKEDWQCRRTDVVESVSRLQFDKMKSCGFCPLVKIESRLSELECAVEDFEKCNPEPKYSRDELLIEIAKRLNIDLI